MKTSKLTSVSVAAAAAAAIALSGSASAADVQPFGTREIQADPGGMTVTAWTVTGLAPSNDAIPYRVTGTLYEAGVTVEAERGNVTPVIAPFVARAASGENYGVLEGLSTAQGLSLTPLTQGQRNTGKLYFDVVGPVPNSVAYTNGTTGDLMVWAGPPTAGAPAPAAPPPPATPAVPMPGAPMMPSPAPAVPMMPGY